MLAVEAGLLVRMTSTEQFALSYLSRDWSVIPIKRRAKQPLILWEPFQRRLPREDEVREWFRRWPNAGVGIVTGAISNLVVIDVDVQHGGDKALAEMERRTGPLPPTIEAITGGGGRHLYFAYPGQPMPNRVGWTHGIDLRSDGGLVVAPPSFHPSGRRYEWKPACDPDHALLAAMPNWLIQAVTGDAKRGGHPVSYWRTLVKRGVREGERNNTIASLTGHLLWHGVDEAVALELLLCWNRTRCNPPLPDNEVQAVVKSIVRTHMRHASEPATPGPIEEWVQPDTLRSGGRSKS
jgi:hypothetical protein